MDRNEKRYQADILAENLIIDNPNRIKSYENWIVFLPKEKIERTIGFIFYPGCQVPIEAYAMLLDKISKLGITCIGVRMPLEQAFLHTNDADQVYNNHPDVTEWYMCGHSLGGAMAIRYGASRLNKIKGVIVLGSYTNKKLSIPNIGIYGTEDMILKQSRFQAMVNGIPIIGGNHAYFGNYGEQKGDGLASITRERQQDITVEEIKKFISFD